MLPNSIYETSIFLKPKLNGNKDSMCPPQLDLRGLLCLSLWRLFFCKNKYSQATEQKQRGKKNGEKSIAKDKTI